MSLRTSCFKDNKIEFPALSSIVEIRAKKEAHDTNLSIYSQGRLKRVSMTENSLNDAIHIQCVVFFTASSPVLLNWSKHSNSDICVIFFCKIYL
jgi:hypothetical protein